MKIDKIIYITFIIVLLFSLLGSFFYLYSDGYNKLSKDKVPIITGDGVGYYYYLPYYFINWEEIPFERLHSASDFDPTGNKYNIGVSVLILPFFLIAHLLSFIFKYPLDGYSYLYQVFAGLSGLFYGFSGILILRKVLKRYFNERITIFSLIAISFGTNLFNYLTSNSLFSHAFSFFLFSLLLYYIPIFYEKPKSLKKIATLAVIFGFIVLVRLINVLSILVIFLYGINTINDLKKRINNMIKDYYLVLFFIFIVFIVFIPQLLTWKLTFNQWIVYSYGNEGFNFKLPHIADSLFSIRRGLFFYSPILLFSIFGLKSLRIKIPEYFLPVIVVLPVIIFINSSWHMWWFGGGFGARAYIEFYPLFILPIASFLGSIKNKKAFISIMIIGIIFIFSTLIRMYWYWTGDLPLDNVTLISYRNIIMNIFK